MHCKHVLDGQLYKSWGPKVCPWELGKCTLPNSVASRTGMGPRVCAPDTNKTFYQWDQWDGQENAKWGLFLIVHVEFRGK